MLQTYEADPCCGEPLAEAISSRELNDDDILWVCPECGCAWKAALVEGIIKHWTANPFVSVF